MTSCPFSKYKNIFGEPNTGIHSFRFFDMAIFDYIFSILGAILITFLTKIPLVITTILVLVLGIILHMLFGVETQAVKFLKINC